MPEKLTQKEVDDLLKALADAPVVSFSDEKAKMVNINIVRKGIWPIPDEAKHYPVCGKYEEFFTLEQQYVLDYGCCQYSVTKQYYPTFICEKCKTQWQFLGENEEK